MKGKIKWFNIFKRFGYITDESGNDIFVHASNIEKGRNFVGFAEGDEVEFDTEVTEKGTQAIGVNMTKANTNWKPKNN